MMPNLGYDYSVLVSPSIHLLDSGIAGKSIR
jgi:hypothetical protein